MSRILHIGLLLSCLVASAVSAPLDVQQWQTRLAAIDRAEQLTSFNAELLASLENSRSAGSASSFDEAAELFGRSVDRARGFGSVSSTVLNDMLVDSKRFYTLCRATLHDLEAQAGEDEAALERLYRSDAWYELNHSLATFRYWQAWLELLLAQTVSDPGVAGSHLARAEHGFQTVAMRILYPGLVYGSWLGLAYVELVRDNAIAAQTRFELLQRAIANDEGNPLLGIVERELSLLAIGRGEVRPMSTEALTAASSRLLTEEAFYLLEQHRETETGAIEAAERLQAVLTSEYLSDALLSRLMRYREEIVGHSIGVLGRLVEAEYAYDYQKYNTVVLKFREFVRQGGMKLPLVLTRYRYHYAVALSKIGLYGEGLQQLNQLISAQDTAPSWLPPLFEMRFAVARDIYDANPDQKNADELRKSALEFIALSPERDSLGGAWLALALLSDDSDEASNYLENASRYPGLEAAVGLTRLKNLSARLDMAYRNNDRVRQQQLAEQGLQVYRELDSESRGQPQASVMALQMAVITAVDIQVTLDEIAQLEQQPALTQPVRRLLYWSRLRALDTLDNESAALQAFIAESVRHAMTAWQRQEVFRLLMEKERAGNFGQLIAIAASFAPALDGAPDNQRQLRLMQLRAYRSLGNNKQAWMLVKELVGDYPDSGDAWVAYAELAGQMGLRFEADRGWASIARSSPPGSPHWLQAMVSRLSLQSGAGERQSACQIQQKILVYRTLLEGPLLETYNLAAAPLDCSTLTPGDD